ncbi:hypothetical protein ACQP2F_18710 [Actinoplanes sp. CA-030573]|uniref:hypothetical protein n=1 Tax=Actinoplanes sp. CA-030573 TaxID=3239898 RepID=UPI003D8BFB72
MKVLKLAAGFAVGYVLGARAGREKFEQIAATARKLNSSPTAEQAKEKAKSAIGSATEKLGDSTNKQPASTRKRREPVGSGVGSPSSTTIGGTMGGTTPTSDPLA